MKFYLIFATLFFAGCTASSKKDLDLSLLKYDATTRSEKIKTGLKRGSNDLASFMVEVYPYTDSLIESSEREGGSKNRDSEGAISKAIESSKQFYTKDRTCFSFEIGAGNIESAQFKNWRAKVEKNDGTLSEISFFSVNGIASLPYFVQSPLDGHQWHNSSTGCLKEKLEIANGFKMYVVSQSHKDAPEAKLEWSVKAK